MRRMGIILHQPEADKMAKFGAGCDTFLKEVLISSNGNAVARIF